MIRFRTSGIFGVSPEDAAFSSSRPLSVSGHLPESQPGGGSWGEAGWRIVLRFGRNDSSFSCFTLEIFGIFDILNHNGVSHPSINT